MPSPANAQRRTAPSSPLQAPLDASPLMPRRRLQPWLHPEQPCAPVAEPPQSVHTSRWPVPPPHAQLWRAQKDRARPAVHLASDACEPHTAGPSRRLHCHTVDRAPLRPTRAITLQVWGCSPEAHPCSQPVGGRGGGGRHVENQCS
eukprot:7380633-Prymnesium_polylepis.1